MGNVVRARRKRRARSMLFLAPRHGFLAKADSATKIATLLLLTIGMQQAHHVRGLLVAAALTAAVLVTCKPPLRLCFAVLLPYSTLVGAVSALQYYTAHLAGTAVAIYALKLVVLALLSLVLISSTPIGELLHGLDRLLTPLRKMGLPTRYLSLGAALSVRFFLMLLTAQSDIAKAQEARGIQAGIRQTAIPLLLKTERLISDVSESLVLRKVNFRNPTALSLRATKWWATSLTALGAAILLAIGIWL